MDFNGMFMKYTGIFIGSNGIVMEFNGKIYIYIYILDFEGI